jgi:hypothetical protein
VALLLGFPLGGLARAHAADEPDGKQIRKWIDQLGSGDFEEREKASAALDSIGSPALEALRKAARGDDVEVRRRALDLIKKIERRSRGAALLTPTRVHLTYRDTPVPDAVADFKKKSGYDLVLLDPQDKLKDRKITLDTGETTFWRAFDLFCQKASLMEVNAQAMPGPEPMRLVPAAPGAPGPVPAKPVPDGVPGQAVGAETVPAQKLPPAAPPPAPALVVMPQVRARMVRMAPVWGPSNAAITLVDGKPELLPTDATTAFRVRALGKGFPFGPTKEEEHRVSLEVAPEPKVQLQRVIAVQVERALDDQGQLLSAALPEADPGAVAIPVMVWGGRYYQMVTCLKKGAKAAKSLKELKGTVQAEVLTAVQPILTVENVLNAAGKTVKGTEGGFIKILEVNKTTEGTKIRCTMELPPSSIPGSDSPAPVMAVPAVPIMPIRPALPGAVPPPGAVPAPAPGQIPGIFRLAAPALPARGMGSAGSGLTLLDDKNTPLPVSQSIQVRATDQGLVTEYILTVPPGKDRGQPAKLVFSGQKNITMDIPFVLKEVRLP